MSVITNKAVTGLEDIRDRTMLYHEDGDQYISRF